jgi:hypothetical protein
MRGLIPLLPLTSLLSLVVGREAITEVVVALVVIKNLLLKL